MSLRNPAVNESSETVSLLVCAESGKLNMECGIFFIWTIVCSNQTMISCYVSTGSRWRVRDESSWSAHFTFSTKLKFKSIRHSGGWKVRKKLVRGRNVGIPLWNYYFQCQELTLMLNRSISMTTEQPSSISGDLRIGLLDKASKWNWCWDCYYKVLL